MQKITPHLWFDKEAREAAELYVSLFPGSRITNVTTLTHTPSGGCDVVSFKLVGQPSWRSVRGPCSNSIRPSPSTSSAALHRKSMQYGNACLPAVRS